MIRVLDNNDLALLYTSAKFFRVEISVGVFSARPDEAFRLESWKAWKRATQFDICTS